MTTNKYGARVTHADNIRFASRKEAHRYGELKLLLAAGHITDLQVHPLFRFVVNGVRVGHYHADFEYVEDGRRVVEDVKSGATRTEAYVIRKRLMEACHGIHIRET